MMMIIKNDSSLSFTFKIVKMENFILCTSYTIKRGRRENQQHLTFLCVLGQTCSKAFYVMVCKSLTAHPFPAEIGIIDNVPFYR